MQNTAEAIFQWLKLNQWRRQVFLNININDKMRTTFSKIKMCSSNSISVMYTKSAT